VEERPDVLHSFYHFDALLHAHPIFRGGERSLCQSLIHGRHVRGAWGLPRPRQFLTEQLMH